MPLDPESMTFDELQDDDEPEDLEDDQPSSNDDDDQEPEEEEVETIDDLDDEELQQAFENTDQDEEEPENNDDVEQDEEDEDVEEQEDDSRFVDDLARQFGIEEEVGEDVDDTWDGALEVARKGAQRLAENEVSNFFEKYPDLQQYAEFRVNGGDPEEFRDQFLNAPDYEDLELEGNESTQERIVREKLSEVEGLSDERVDDRVERYKSAGILKSEAEDAKDILANKQEERREQMMEEQRRKREQREQEVQEELQEYKETIRNSSEVAGLQIPESDKDAFENYLFEPVDEESGMTQAQKDYQEMDKEQALALYYLTFQGLDNLGDLIDNEASTKRAEELSKKLKKSSSRDVNDKSQRSRDRKKSSEPNLEGFNLDSAIG